MKNLSYLTTKTFLIPLGLIFISIALGFIFTSGNNLKSAAADEIVNAQKDSSNKDSISSGNSNIYLEGENKEIPEGQDRGEYLYVQGCSTCHGVDGRGSEMAPGLHGVGAAAVDFWVGTGRMPATNSDITQQPRKDPVYTQEDINELSNYITENFGEGPEVPKLDLENADLVEGGQLYANNCAACHNSQGSGGTLGGNYYAPNLYEATPTHIAEAIRIGPGGVPIFGDQTFSEEQVSSIVKYVEYLKSSETNPGGLTLGGLGPVSEGLVAWLGGLVLLLMLTRWIGTRV